MARFSLSRLHDLAGEPVFARGDDYFRRGKVTLISADVAGVLAEVHGTETYRVRLTGQDQAIGGDCTCPAFEREGWCKHLVATALAANAAGEALPDRRAPIRAHLLGLGAVALAEMLLDLAWKDTSLLRKLDLAARGAAATPADHADLLQAQLDEALAEGCDADTQYPYEWLDEVAAVVEQLPALIDRDGAAAAMAMIESILDDLPEALETLEDEAMPAVELLDRVVALHLDACHALRPDPLALAEDLFEREVDGDGFEGAADRYADLLGEAGLAEYRRLAEAAFARLPPRISGGVIDQAIVRRQVLVGILDRFAERDGDLDRRIALRRGEVFDARTSLALARFCLEQGRPDLALEAAEDGVGRYATDWDEALPLFLAERLVAAGRQADALAALWRRFEARPSHGVFAALRVQVGPDAVDCALGLLCADPRFGPDTVPLQLKILSGAGRLAEAWVLARQHPLLDNTLLDLAKMSEATLPAEAATTYRMLAARNIALTSRHGYETACIQLGRLAAIEPLPVHRSYVLELRQRHKAKRSLLPLLDRHLAALEAAPIPARSPPAA